MIFTAVTHVAFLISAGIGEQSNITMAFSHQSSRAENSIRQIYDKYKHFKILYSPDNNNVNAT